MPEVGKVKYTVEVDTSGIAQDVKKAEKEIEKSNIGDSLDANVSAGAGKASASVKKATGDIDASVSTSSKLTTAASVALGGAMVMAGEYALEFGANMVDVAVDYDSALSQMQAATGASAAEMESLGEIMESIYAGNYGEDFGDIADAIATVKTNIGDLNDSDLQNLTESAITLRDTFGYDITESTRAAKAMMDNFGVSGDEAMNLIATGAQNGLDYSGELLDSISEYSVQFQKLGLSADDMFKIIEKGAETGAWNVDKIGDAVKEMSIRVIDGSETTRQGFETVGLSADEMSAKFAAGGETARDAFFETIEALAAMEDPIAQNSAGVALFGTMWEDLGPEVVTALAEIEDGAYATGDALEKMKEVKYDNLGSALEGIGRSLEVLLLPVIQALLPFLTEIIEAILPLLQALLDPLVAILEAIVEPILGIIEALMPLITIILETLTPVLQTLGELFSGVFSQILTVVSEVIGALLEVIQPIITLIQEMLGPVIEWLGEIVSEHMDGILETVSDVIGSIKKVLGGIIDFIAGVFTGDWGRAWEGVKSIFSGIIEGIASIFKTPINWIIDGINKFIRGINRIRIPNWVPFVGGKGFNISTIPRLKAGIDYVPGDFFPAYLDKGEMVLTAEEAARYRSAGGVGGIPSSAYYSGVRGPVRIDVHTNIDGREVARATAWWMGEQLSWEEM